jgi:hypothetical protein
MTIGDGVRGLVEAGCYNGVHVRIAPDIRGAVRQDAPLLDLRSSEDGSVTLPAVEKFSLDASRSQRQNL